VIKEFSISTSNKTSFIEITDRLREITKESKIKEGILHVYIPHTTAGVTINENADPSVKHDIISKLDDIVPEDSGYTHAEGNSPAHIKSSMLGNSCSVFISDGRLMLGTWQGVFFCEFDGPRKRKVIVNVQKSQ
jgi:secondary thiamine-phosphate synthase enzyme